MKRRNHQECWNEDTLGQVKEEAELCNGRGSHRSNNFRDGDILKNVVIMTKKSSQVVDVTDFFFVMINKNSYNSLIVCFKFVYIIYYTKQTFTNYL